MPRIVLRRILPERVLGRAVITSTRRSDRADLVADQLDELSGGGAWIGVGRA
jgi:hypothetical protein